MSISWDILLEEESQKPYFKSIFTEINQQKSQKKTIYPPEPDIFRALTLTPFDAVKVVILGQDPYHGEGQAHGLAFSVPDGISIPPSLRNIFKELQRDLGKTPPTSGCLDAWAKQGVLLLNDTLTVVANHAHSHATIGWQTFTDAVITSLNHHPQPIAFLLWGKAAAKKAASIQQAKHLCLTAPHPSPLSCHRGFIGCGHFSTTNRWLKEQGQSCIQWL